MRTATDVLRLAVALSDGDVSLAEATKFTKFRRSDRKQMLAWLEATGDPTEDMFRWQEPWKRLGERLHPGDYADAFPKTYRAFCVVRNDEPFDTFNRRIERSFTSRDTSAVLKLLEQRPGDLARRLDHLLRLSDQPGDVLETFASAVEGVSSAVLLQVLTHFRHRSEPPRPLRSFFPKGEVAKVFATPNRLPALPAGARGNGRFHMRTSPARAVSSVAVARQVLRRSGADELPRAVLAAVGVEVAADARAAGSRTAAAGLHDRCGSSSGGRTAAAARTSTCPPRSTMPTRVRQDARVLQPEGLRGAHSGDIVDAPKGRPSSSTSTSRSACSGRSRYVVMSLEQLHRSSRIATCRSASPAGWREKPQLRGDLRAADREGQGRRRVEYDDLHPADLRPGRTRGDLGGHRPRASNPRGTMSDNNLSGVSLMLRSLTSLVKTDLHTLFDSARAGTR